MSFADTLKGLIFKKPATAAGRDKRDPRQTMNRWPAADAGRGR
jgi:hypothetical protein